MKPASWFAAVAKPCWFAATMPHTLSVKLHGFKHRTEGEAVSPLLRYSERLSRRRPKKQWKIELQNDACHLLPLQNFKNKTQGCQRGNVRQIDREILLAQPPDTLSTNIHKSIHQDLRATLH